MNPDLRIEAAELRQKSSKAATDWLLTRYPVGSADWGNALTLLEHISLRHADRMVTARHYLSRIPYASDRPYRVFAKLLQLDDLVRVLSDSLPTAPEDRKLVRYHVEPVLRGMDGSESAKEIVDLFVSTLSPGQPGAG
jgi:hypothetical protein